MSSYCRRFRFGFLVLGFSLAGLLALRAGETAPAKAKAKPAAKQAKEDDPLKFWFDPRRAQPAAAAELILAQNPFTAALLRLSGKTWVVWGELEIGDDVPELHPEWLDAAHDRDRKPMPDLRGRAPDEITKSERAIYSLYTQALVYAFRYPESAFAKKAKENEDVTFAHMYRETSKFRGKILHVEGHLKLLRKWDATVAAQAQGVRHVYEGWIHTQTRGAHPVCVLFPVLPEGLKPAEAGKIDRWVEFDGYLISLFRYTTTGRGERDTPLLIGPTLKLGDQPPVADEKPLVSPALLYGFVSFVIVVAGLVAGLSWWFRRGDQRVRRHLDEIRAQRTVEMLENDLDNPKEGNGFLTDHD
jgi:hypothetical protein